MQQIRKEMEASAQQRLGFSGANGFNMKLVGRRVGRQARNARTRSAGSIVDVGVAAGNDLGSARHVLAVIGRQCTPDRHPLR